MLESWFLAIVVLEVGITAIMGNYFFYWIAKRFGVSSKNILLSNICMLGIVPLWGIAWLKSAAEMAVAAALFGFTLGSVQSYSRSLYTRLTPPGQESEFFAFYEFTDKGTSWLGPLLLTIVIENSEPWCSNLNQRPAGGITPLRWAVFMIFFFFVIGFFILFFTNIEKGIRDALLFNPNIYDQSESKVLDTERLERSRQVRDDEIPSYADIAVARQQSDRKASMAPLVPFEQRAMGATPLKEINSRRESVSLQKSNSSVGQ